jgi:4-hydroxymandelate oxidase
MHMTLDTCINLADVEALAREKLAGSTAWDYYEGGAEDEYAIAENCAAFRRIKLRPRVLVDVATRDLSTEVLGQHITLPVLLGPTALQRMAHPDAELATARAAAAAGTIGVFSTEAHYSIRETAAATEGPLWFQLYCYASREVTARLIANAEAAGCRALVVTVDASYDPRRERHLRRPLVIPPEVAFGNLIEAGLSGGRDRNHATPMPALTWADLAWLRSTTRMSILLKGIMTGEDAALAVEHGVDGVIVSNHGGRQIDGTLASIEMLSEVVAQVGGRTEVLVDGGIRRGTDVLKALALGAKAVLIARPYLWGLAVGGEAGVRQVLEMLRAEIDCAMAQLGVAAVKSIDRSLVTIR